MESRTVLLLGKNSSRGGTNFFLLCILTSQFSFGDDINDIMTNNIPPSCIFSGITSGAATIIPQIVALLHM